MEPPWDVEDIYRARGLVLWRALMAYTGGRREIADDAVAETFARAIANPGQIREVVPWLFRVAFRIAASEMKREDRERSTERMPDEALPERVDTTDLFTALRRLTPTQRAAVYLHYQADRPVTEVAALIGSTVPAVKVHLFRGRQRLRKLLEDRS